jgi:proteasome accessory factor A
MSARLVTPEDFYSEQPPDRTIGGETEYDVRRLDGTMDFDWLESFFTSDVLDQANLAAFATNGHTWLSNGAMIYPDVQHLEYCTPESLGPAEATAAIHAGSLVIARMIDGSGEPYKVFRRSATVNAETGKVVTKGYHLNFGTPDELCAPHVFSALEPHLATQLYAWGGLVTKQGYSISPKAYDIGDNITVIGSANRTGTGRKPFGIIRPSGSDADTNAPKYNLGRFEDRTKTPSSEWSDFRSMATTSLMMRVIESPALERELKVLQSLRLRNSVATFKQVAADVPMSNTYELADGRRMKALDIQEICGDLAMAATEKLSLPDDEVLGSQQWQLIVDELRRIERGEGTLADVANRIGWAGKYVVLSRKLGEAAVNEGSIDALRYCLSWDMVVPKGAGQIFEAKQGTEIISQEAVRRLTTEAPRGTRAHSRSQYIKDRGTNVSGLIDVAWPFVTLAQGGDTRRVVLHPYEAKRPKLGGRHGRRW